MKESLIKIKLSLIAIKIIFLINRSYISHVLCNNKILINILLKFETHIRT